MGLRKSTTPKTSTDRLNAAHSLALGATASLREAVLDLEDAAETMADVHEEATAEAARHAQIADDALAAQAVHLATAEKIAALFG